MRSISVSQVSREGTLATAIGVDEETGERLAFYGDTRMMEAVEEAIDDAKKLDIAWPVCDVEEWQIAGQE